MPSTADSLPTDVEALRTIIAAQAAELTAERQGKRRRLTTLSGRT
jgi:hypothetical protein